jgi:hypothetical protein
MPALYSAYPKALRSKVQALYDEGLADYPMKPQIAESMAEYSTWPGFEMRPGPHISRVYLEIEQEAFE